MLTKSTCLVCRGRRIKIIDGVEHQCLGCEGHGYVMVKHVAEKRPEANFDVDTETQVKKKEHLPVDASLPSPQQNRKSLHIRASRFGLLDRILTAIEEHQREYLKTRDIMKLRPMVLRDIAPVAGCDEATCCIYLKNEYIDDIPVKKLFSEAVCGISNTVLKHMVKIMVDKELIPMSDTELVRQFELQGITISRRTMTKYRKEMKIPAKNERKKLDRRNIADK